MEQDPRRWTRALRASHDALSAQVCALSPNQLVAASYCKDWDVSQVLGHLGSGAEVALTNLERVLAGSAPLGREDFPVIWGRWNELGPEDKASQMVVWDRRHVSVLQALDDETVKSLRVPWFGTELDVAGVVGFRLGEHVVHSWDVAVAFDPAAELLEVATGLLLERLGFIVERTGKPAQTGVSGRVEIRTARPERRFVLSLEDKAKLSDDFEGPVDTTLELPAAAFARLVYGRLDPGHTPGELKLEGKVDLDDLRRVFPGF